MAGDDREAGAEVAVRDGNARIRRHGGVRRHAGHDLERNARVGQRLGFFAAASEDERIAALETHDELAFPRFAEDERVDDLLRIAAVVARFLAAEDEFRRGRGQT